MSVTWSVAPLQPDASSVLDFWFGAAPEWRAVWFRADTDFDAAITTRFGALPARAARGELDIWAGCAAGAVALCLVQDQFPRNLFRGSARAFAWDGRARALAGCAVARGWDPAVPALWRQFLYLPFMHSEDLADQDRSVALYGALAAAGEAWAGSCLRSAERHRAVIARFGRYPGRNAALGRVSSAAELSFLAEYPAGF
jgi:uncharacterized protein (DUF924 family)